MDVSHVRATPGIGDIIGCRDGDVGIVLSIDPDTSGPTYVEISWCSGRILTDPWNSVDFRDDYSLFWIMSRA